MQNSRTAQPLDQTLTPSQVVEIGEIAVADAPTTVLGTSPLGGCVGIAMYDPVARLGGILQPLLPDSALDPARAESQPGLFVDTGVDQLLAKLLDGGADRDQIEVYVAGAAQPRQIGQGSPLGTVGVRNLRSLGQVLVEHGLKVVGCRTGGCRPVELYLRIGDGAVAIRDAANSLERL